MQKETFDTAVPRTPNSSIIGVHSRRVTIFLMKAGMSPLAMSSSIGTPRPLLICQRVMMVYMSSVIFWVSGTYFTTTENWSMVKDLRKKEWAPNHRGRACCSQCAWSKTWGRWRWGTYSGSLSELRTACLLHLSPFCLRFLLSCCTKRVVYNKTASPNPATIGQVAQTMSRERTGRNVSVIVTLSRLNKRAAPSFLYRIHAKKS